MKTQCILVTAAFLLVSGLAWAQSGDGAVGPLYPGNGADLDIAFRVNGTLSSSAILPVDINDAIEVSFYTPNGGLAVAPFLAAFDVRPTGSYWAPQTLPGDAAGSIWLDPASTMIAVNGFSTFGQLFSPVLYFPGGFNASSIVPPSLGGMNLSVWVQCFAYAPGFNLVSLGVSPAYEFRVN
jgi:hypothetical protein